ncbi:MAG TPA: FAD-binding oxidoreductase [Vicinamibacterales bacterium]|nr:FAD-binding oxidoreductase [Vicinamibacterales bacterium]
MSRPPHRATARAPQHTAIPPIERDPDVVRSFLSDAAHVPGGSAEGVVFPATVDEVAAVVASASRVLPVGAQSSLTGGATPRGDLVLSTRRLSHIAEPRERTVRVGAGVPLAELHRFLAARGLYYPPAPTFDGAFIGGTIATNAAGPATFKYGVTRPWVAAITVVLADGSILDLARGEVRASGEGVIEIQTIGRGLVHVPVPAYEVPTHLPKLSAGYFAGRNLDLLDLFVGSEGTLGVIAEATVRITPRPLRCVVLVPCESEGQAVTSSAALAASALEIAAIEYMDSRSLQLLDDGVYARAGISRPPVGATLLLVQVETEDGLDAALARLDDILQTSRVAGDPVVALPDDERTAARLFELREAVPAAVNARVGDAKARIHPGIQKTAGDFIVPVGSIDRALALYRGAFDRRGLEYAIWGHISDGNLHPNLIPRSLEDVEAGRDALREMARGVIELGGAPVAEHGVGRNPLKQRFLRDLYGDEGIEQMRAVKRALDPEGKFAAGVLFAAARTS